MCIWVVGVTLPKEKPVIGLKYKSGYWGFYVAQIPPTHTHLWVVVRAHCRIDQMH